MTATEETVIFTDPEKRGHATPLEATGRSTRVTEGRGGAFIVVSEGRDG